MRLHSIFHPWAAVAAVSMLSLIACGGGDHPKAADSPAAATAARARALAATPAPAKPGVAPAAFSSYEAAHVHPLDMTPDGKKLLSVNTANGTLEVFDVSGATVTLASVIKVGMDPVTVRAASNTEAWVVNVLSDSVNVVDLSTGNVKATLATDDEPADVVFAGSPRRAYISCAQARTLLVVDPASPTTVLSRIPIQGQQPRALATSADGSKVYLAIFESGNGTTVLSGKINANEPNSVTDPNGPYKGVNPPPNANGGTTFNPPLNPANPAPPAFTGMIVRRTATGDWLDDNGRSWKPWVTSTAPVNGAKTMTRVAGWDLIDRDVAVIDTTTQAVSYQGGMMNLVMAMAVNPASGQVTVVGTDATNQIRFEPVVRGTFLKVLFGGFQPGGANTIKDINPHLTYTTPSVAVSERQKSIGDPRGIAWNATGTKAYVTGLGSNNLIVLDAQGNRAGINQTLKVGQGPTGVVLQESQKRAFVLNRFDATVSVVDLTTETVTDTVALSYDPTPQVVKDGRPMLYDTQRFSGLGQISCASCHVDGKTDRLAWDLGNPAGTMGSSIDNTTSPPTTIPQHPMKGPLLTQTLVDTMQSPFLHWRGDRADLAHFSGAFQSLQGADAPATADEIAKMQAFLATLRTPPNPYRNLDNSYPTAVQIPGPRGTIVRTGNAVAGAQEFEQGCRSCHPGHTNRGVFFFSTADTTGGIFLNPPKWQNFYRRDGLYFNDATGSTAGFGFRHDGTLDSSHNNMRTDNMMAFMYAFNGSYPYTPAGLNATNVAVDSHAAVGKQVTLTAASPAPALLDQLVTLANNQAISLVASACVNNEQRGYAWAGNGQFQSDRAGDTVSVAGFRALATSGTPVTIMAVRGGTQGRIGIDQEQDGVLDGTQGVTPLRACTTPPPVAAATNLALGKVATQSSLAYGGSPSRAVDGNTDGAWGNNSVTHTDITAQPWWQVDLGQSSSIVSVNLFNRIDCCTDRLASFYVFVSASDMSTKTLAQLTADTTVAKIQVASLNGASSINLPLASTGRYVRVQLTGTNYLSLAEVQVLGSAAAGATPTPTTGGLTGSYFANASLSGTVALTRTENVDFDWGGGSPNASIPVDNFSARWTGSLIPPTTGGYNFATVSDDGVRVWINGALVIDNWSLHGPTTNTATGIQLTAGQAVSARIEYFEQTGGATVRWQWQPPGSGAYVAVPASVLGAN